MYHHASSSIIFHHHPASSIIIHHHASSSIIMPHHASSCLIVLHHPSSSIISHHHASSCIIMPHHASSCLIIRHHSSSIIIRHHASSSIIIHHPSSYIIPAVLSPRNSAAHPYKTIKGGENDLNRLNPDMLTGPKLYASFFSRVQCGSAVDGWWFRNLAEVFEICETRMQEWGGSTWLVTDLLKFFHEQLKQQRKPMLKHPSATEAAEVCSLNFILKKPKAPAENPVTQAPI